MFTQEQEKSFDVSIYQRFVLLIDPSPKNRDPE